MDDRRIRDVRFLYKTATGREDGPLFMNGRPKRDVFRNIFKFFNPPEAKSPPVVGDEAKPGVPPWWDGGWRISRVASVSRRGGTRRVSHDAQSVSWGRFIILFRQKFFCLGGIADGTVLR